MEVGGAFLTLGKALLQRVTEHLKRSRCSYSEFQHAAPPPSLLRDPLRLGEIHEADPPPPPHLAVKQLAGPRPGAAQCPLLPPGGWASPSRTQGLGCGPPTAWLLRPQQQLPKPTHVEHAGDASETPLGASSQAVCWRLGCQSLRVSETHTQPGENYTPRTLTSRGKSLASRSHRGG